MANRELFLRFFDHRWQLTIPERWLAIFEKVFAGILTENGAVDFRITCGAATPDEHQQLAALRAQNSPNDVLAMRNGDTLLHLTSAAWFCYDRARQAGEFKLLSDNTDEVLQGANLLLRFFIWECEKQDICPIHAALISTPTATLLLPASSGSGKSTLAFCAFLKGLAVQADDFCFLKATDESYVAQGVYNSCRLTSHSVALLDSVFGLQQHDRQFERADGKQIFLLNQARSSCLPSTVTAIVIPQLRPDKRHGIERLTDAAAFRAFASTLKLIAANQGNLRLTFATLQQLVKRLPCYLLSVGNDLASLPKFLAAQFEHEYCDCPVHLQPPGPYPASLEFARRDSAQAAVCHR